MAQCNSTIYLKDLLKNILTTKASDQEILQFIQFCSTDYDFSDIEKNLLILEIYIVLKRTNNFIPLIDFSLDALPEKIILKSGIVSNKKENVENVPKCDIPYTSNTTQDLERFRQTVIDHYSPFLPSKNPGIVYPAAGEIGNLFIEDRELVPGKHFSSEVLIDHDGNIVSFIKGPTEIIDTEDYDQIYQGLVGQLFTYQQNAE